MKEELKLFECEEYCAIGYFKNGRLIGVKYTDKKGDEGNE